MDPGLVIWKVTWSKITNGYEIEAPDGFFLGNFQLDPDSEMWKGFWSRNIEWTLVLWSGRVLGRKVRMDVSVGCQMEFPWEISNWTLARRCRRDFGQEMLNGPRIGDLGGDLVRRSK